MIVLLGRKTNRLMYGKLGKFIIQSQPSDTTYYIARKDGSTCREMVR